jgi:hypothetical protein
MAQAITKISYVNFLSVNPFKTNISLIGPLDLYFQNLVTKFHVGIYSQVRPLCLCGTWSRQSLWRDCIMCHAKQNAVAKSYK